MMRAWTLKTLTGMIFGAALFFGGAGFAATGILPDTCDAKLHDLIRSRAWMEAQREVEVAETLILKPDSVLTYSCFDDLLSDTKTINLFQEDLSGNIDGAFSGMSFSCEAMNDLFADFRCTDVDHPPENFLPSLKDLVDGEIRSCSNSTRNDHWNAADAIVFATPPPRPVTEGGPDKVEANFDKLEGTNCSSTFIFESGIEVTYIDKYTQAQETKEWGVCLAPTCFYNGSTCVQAP